MSEIAITKAKNIIEGYYDGKPLSDKFLRLHSFSNENQKDLLNLFEYKDTSKVLTCDDSSDQIFNLISHGCNDISVLSTNPFIAHYFELKKVALHCLKQKEFLNFFLGTDPNQTQKKGSINLFDKKIYNEISTEMRTGSRRFWNALFRKYNPSTIRNKLFLPAELSREQIINNNDYLNVEKYNTLKSRLNDAQIMVYQDSLPILSYIGDDYDLIFLSNYIERHLDLSQENNYDLIMKIYIEFVKIVENKLKKEGIMCYQYVSDVKNSYFERLFDEYLSSFSKRIYIPSASNIEGQSDGVYIIRKRTLK